MADGWCWNGGEPMTVTDVTTVASKETPAEVTAERRGTIFADLSLQVSPQTRRTARRRPRRISSPSTRPWSPLRWRSPAGGLWRRMLHLGSVTFKFGHCDVLFQSRASSSPACWWRTTSRRSWTSAWSLTWCTTAPPAMHCNTLQCNALQWTTNTLLQVQQCPARDEPYGSVKVHLSSFFYSFSFLLFFFFPLFLLLILLKAKPRWRTRK